MSPLIEMPSVLDFVCQATGSTEVREVTPVQTLWSGYGQIARFELVGGPIASAIVKWVSPPDQTNHPRGWDSDWGHQRKLKSYEVELNWYRDFSARCDLPCRVAACYGTRAREGQFLFVLEDLDASGYPRRQSSLDAKGVEAGLRYLANFHAKFLGQEPLGLWPVGTYWHFATRPDEWQAMPSGELKTHAAAIDAMLNRCQFKTLVHGDAKVSNFCFSKDLQQLAAVDFQYVGGGCGSKDVAYFLGSCLDEAQCQQGETHFLNVYFSQLRESLRREQIQVSPADVESEWRGLYPVAWADFTRFMQGWSPRHAKLNRYSLQITQRVIDNLDLKAFSSD